MNQTQPLLSFITVCYNGWSDTYELIESIQRLIYSVTYEIIVVDNCSSEDRLPLLNQKYPRVITLRCPQNLGFAGGNNAGLRVSNGRYIFLINNDTYFCQDNLRSLIDRLEKYPTIGAVSPKICFAFPPQNIQFAGYTPLSNLTIRNKLVGFSQPDDGRFDIPHSTPYLHGAALLFKREVLLRAGQMSDIYFLYYEELDWSTRLTNSGYELWYDPCCTVFHKESQSTGQESPLRTFYLTRNRLLYAWRNRKGVSRYLSLLYLLTVAVGKSTLQHLRHGHFALLNATYRAIIAFILIPHKMKGI